MVYTFLPFILSLWYIHLYLSSYLYGLYISAFHPISVVYISVFHPTSMVYTFLCFILSLWYIHFCLCVLFHCVLLVSHIWSQPPLSPSVSAKAVLQRAAPTQTRVWCSVHRPDWLRKNQPADSPVQGEHGHHRAHHRWVSTHTHSYTRTHTHTHTRTNVQTSSLSISIPTQHAILQCLRKHSHTHTHITSHYQ